MKSKYLQVNRKQKSHLWNVLLAHWDFVQSNTLQGPNYPIWSLTENDAFTTKSARLHSRVKSQDWSIAMFIGKSYIPLKLNIFVWKLWNKWVQTDGKPKICFILLASKCYCCCQGNDDSDNHLFAYGELATYLWNHASSIFGLGDLKGLDWKQKCIKWWNCIRGTSQFNIMANCVPIFICWEIWCYRNKRKYDDIALSPQSILHKCIIWPKDMNFIINPKKVSSFFDVFNSLSTFYP